MNIEKPKASIKNQNHVNKPPVGDSTLVDDSVALVDDTVALVGGLASTYSNMPLTIKPLVPRPLIKISR